MSFIGLTFQGTQRVLGGFTCSQEVSKLPEGLRRIFECFGTSQGHPVTFLGSSGIFMGISSHLRGVSGRKPLKVSETLQEVSGIQGLSRTL